MKAREAAPERESSGYGLPRAATASGVDRPYMHACVYLKDEGAEEFL